MQKLTAFWHDLRVRAKFLLILLLSITLVSTAALGAMFIPLRAYDEQLYQSSAHTIALFAEQIQSELQNYEAISYRILADNALQKNLSIMHRAAPGTVRWLDANTEIDKSMAYFSLWFSNTISFQLKTVRGHTYSQFFGASVTADRLTPERTALASGNSGRAVWLTEESPAPRLLLLREVREIEGLTFQPLATVAIEVDFPALVEQYRRGMAQTGTPLRCGVYRAGICLYASDETVRTLPEGADGYTRMKLDGQDVLCVRYTAADGMRYAALTDYSGIHTTLFFSFTLTIVVILASMLLAIFISVTNYKKSRGN